MVKIREGVHGLFDRTRACLFVFLLAGVGAPSAFAQAGSAVAGQTEPAGYRELVGEALSEYASGNYEESRTHFARAHALFPNARTHRGLGMAEFELRNYEACLEQLDAALASSVRPLDPRLRAETEALRVRSQAFLGRLVLESTPATTLLLVDGLPTKLSASGSVVLRMGVHMFEARAEGMPTERRKVVIRGGEQHTLRIHFKALPVAQVERRSWVRSPWLWSAMGVLAAGAAAGAAVALTRGSKQGTYDGGSTDAVGRAP